MGMEKYESIVRVASDDELLATSENARSGGRKRRRVDEHSRHRGVSPGVVLLFGSERFGIPKPVIARAERTIAIPIYGVNHSLRSRSPPES